MRSASGGKLILAGYNVGSLMQGKVLRIIAQTSFVLLDMTDRHQLVEPRPRIFLATFPAHRMVIGESITQYNQSCTKCRCVPITAVQTCLQSAGVFGTAAERRTVLTDGQKPSELPAQNAPYHGCCRHCSRKISAVKHALFSGMIGLTSVRCSEMCGRLIQRCASRYN